MFAASRRARLRGLSPDPTPLDIALHGGGPLNIPDIAVWMWRWPELHRSRTRRPSRCGDGGYFFSALGGPSRCFNAARGARAFARLYRRSRYAGADHPQAASRRESGQLLSRRACNCSPTASRLTAPDRLRQPEPKPRIAACCRVADGKIAIDPELGRIQYAADLRASRTELRVNYRYGSPAEMGGGPYDRSDEHRHIRDRRPFWPASAAPTIRRWRRGRRSGTARRPDRRARSCCRTSKPTTSILTGPNAIQIPAQSQLLLAAAESLIVTGAAVMDEFLRDAARRHRDRGAAAAGPLEMRRRRSASC